MEKNKSIKKYKLRVALDWPDIWDDVLVIELPFSDEDIQNLTNKALQLYWVRNSIETWEYIEAFLPEVYNQGVVLAEAYCVPLFGIQAKVENGAQYDFFLPDEIHDAVFNSESWQNENKIRRKLQKKSSMQYQKDIRMLRKAYKEGLFGNNLIGDPAWNNQIFSGIWSEGHNDYAAVYSIQTLVVIDGITIKVEYEKFFLRNYVELRVELRPPLGAYLKDFFSKNSKHYKHDDFEQEPDYSPPAMITKSRGYMYDIRFFISFLEYLTST